jgi:hypothetical protein
VETIRRWRNPRGRPGYPAAARLLVTADAGGPQLKTLPELTAYAQEHGIART